MANAFFALLLIRPQADGYPNASPWRAGPGFIDHFGW